jgi:hypothetical protein
VCSVGSTGSRAMDQDQEIEDFNDSTWDQAQRDEQQMLSEDPGYFIFLLNYERIQN